MLEAEGPGEGLRPIPGAAHRPEVTYRRHPVNAGAMESPSAVPSKGYFSLYSPPLWMTLRKALLEKEVVDKSL